MNKKTFSSFLVFVGLACGLYIGYRWFLYIPDEIVESVSIADVYNYIKPDEYKKNLLVIFDIDNTIAKTPTDLGSDQWFYAKKNALLEKGVDEKDVYDLILPELFHIQFNSWLIPVEEGSVQVVNDLQKKGVSVIALTARSLDLTYRTIEQLDRLGIHFTKTNPHECPLSYGKKNKKAGLYIDGIIFSGPYKKGEMIVDWLRKTGYRPDKVIFIDDKLKNIEDVEKSLHMRDYPFIGIRYGHEDERVKAFTLESVSEEEKVFFNEHPFNNRVALP